MAGLHDSITHIQKTLKEEIHQASDLAILEKIRISYLGRNGKIAQLMGQMKELPVDEKRVLGPALNQLKKQAQAWYEQRKNELKNRALEHKQQALKNFDVTAYYTEPLQGSLHVFTQLIDELQSIFTSMGYSIADGPELETDYYNFETLNIPKDHPARDTMDTFWVNVPDRLLRTHTSTVQAHAMEERELPLAIFAPGRVFRNESIDASHDIMFMQCEGMYIDKHVSMSHLLATTRAFLQAIFKQQDLEIRIRPGYFPFVEPGIEIDFSCTFCKEDECSVCKKTGWVEFCGAGLIHPNVLRSSGIDPDMYSGFAFGFGLERLAMIKYGINDIRTFRTSKIQFLKQF